MAKMQFWGSLEGRGKLVERGGTKDSGLEVEAAGWRGRVCVIVWHNSAQGVDEFQVMLRPHWSDDGESKMIASGILDHRALEDPFIPALIA